MLCLLSLFLRNTHTHTLTHTHIHSLTHTHTHSLTHLLVRTHTHIHSHKHTLTLVLGACSHKHASTHTHTLTHTSTLLHSDRKSVPESITNSFSFPSFPLVLPLSPSPFILLSLCLSLSL